MMYHPKVLPVTPRIQYIADGERKTFPFPFVIFEETDLEVFQDNVTVRSGFAIKGIGDSVGGVAEFDQPPPAGVTLTLRRNLQIQRTTDFQQSGILSANVLNNEFDQLTAAVQQVSADANRAIRLAPTDAEATLVLPGKNTRAGRGLSFDVDGNLTTHALSANDGSVQGTLDGIPEGVTNKHFSAGEKSKLATIEMGAQANPPAATAGEKTDGTLTQARSFTPRDIADMVSTHGTSSEIASVFGRKGGVVAENGDYNAGQITNTPNGSIVATNVQAAINELDGEKAAASRKVIAGAGLSGGGDLTADRTFAVSFAGSGVANSAARSDHAHDSVYARQSRLIATVGSLTGGGDLTGDRSLSLINDAATPGNNRYYGTDASGAKGWFTLPAGGTGGIDGTDDVFTRPYDRVVLANHLVSGPYTPSWVDGPYLVLTLSANIIALNRPSVIAGAPANAMATMTLELMQDATGGRSVALNVNPASGGFTLIGGLPILDTQPGRSTSLTFYTRDGGNTWALLGLAQASEVGFSPSGTLTTSTVQTALVEVDSKKVAATRKIIAGAGLQGGGDLTVDRSLSVDFSGTGTALTAARSDHGHGGLVPSAGNAGQVLRKVSGANYDFAWSDAGTASSRLIASSGSLAAWANDATQQTVFDVVIPGGTLVADGDEVTGRTELIVINNSAAIQYLLVLAFLGGTKSFEDSTASFSPSAAERAVIVEVQAWRNSATSGRITARLLMSPPKALTVGAAGDFASSITFNLLGFGSAVSVDWTQPVAFKLALRMTNAHPDYSVQALRSLVVRS